MTQWERIGNRCYISFAYIRLLNIDLILHSRHTYTPQPFKNDNDNNISINMQAALTENSGKTSLSSSGTQGTFRSALLSRACVILPITEYRLEALISLPTHLCIRLIHGHTLSGTAQVHRRATHRAAFSVQTALYKQTLPYYPVLYEA